MVLPDIVCRYVEIESCAHHVITPDGPDVHRSIADDLCQYIGLAEQSRRSYVHGNITETHAPRLTLT